MLQKSALISPVPFLYVVIPQYVKLPSDLLFQLKEIEDIIFIDILNIKFNIKLTS